MQEDCSIFRIPNVKHEEVPVFDEVFSEFAELDAISEEIEKWRESNS